MTDTNMNQETQDIAQKTRTNDYGQPVESVGAFVVMVSVMASVGVLLSPLMSASFV
ncbi:MAG: hypothetical protein AAGB25_03795 [Pseudomonadota bacterium]